MSLTGFFIYIYKDNYLMTTNLTTMLAGDTTLTMSSREIATLCEKEHFNVLIDIRKMFSDLQIGDLSFQGSYISTQNKPMPEYNLPKDLTITLVSGYKVQLRHRIVTRWIELESQQGQVQIPQTLPEALRLGDSCYQ